MWALARDAAVRADLVRRRSFDAVEDLARAFPVAVTLDLIGLPEALTETLPAAHASATQLLSPDKR